MSNFVHYNRKIIQAIYNNYAIDVAIILFSLYTIRRKQSYVHSVMIIVRVTDYVRGTNYC